MLVIYLNLDWFSQLFLGSKRLQCPSILTFRYIIQVIQTDDTFRSERAVYINLKTLFDIYMIKYVIYSPTMCNFNTSGNRLNVKTYFVDKNNSVGLGGVTFKLVFLLWVLWNIWTYLWVDWKSSQTVGLKLCFVWHLNNNKNTQKSSSLDVNQ